VALAEIPKKRASANAGGVVYTPRPLTAFVVDRLLSGARAPTEARWLDPACGDGVFLVEIVQRIACRARLAQVPDAVEKRVFGIDIDEAACRRARRAVVNAVENLCGPQDGDFFVTNVRVGDFLELDPGADGGADLVVGNPPYVSALNLSQEERARYLRRFQTAWGRLDLYALFIEQGLRHLADGGSLAYITPDKWLLADSSRRLRSFVAQEFRVRSIDRFDRHDLFPRVATVPCVTVIDAQRGRLAPLGASIPCRWWDVDGSGQPITDGAVYRVKAGVDGQPWVAAAPVRPSSPTARPLGDFVERISVGMATGLNRCFILDAKQAVHIEPELLRPVVRGRDVLAEELAQSGRWMLVPYLFAADGSSPELIDLAQFPGAQEHLERHREALEQRHCVRVWGKAWHDLHDPVTCDLARRRKILLPDVAREPRFALEPGRVLPLHSAYYMLPRADAPISAEHLTSVLNRPDIAEELRRRAPTAKSGYRRFRAQVLREFLVPLGRPEPAASDAA